MSCLPNEHNTTNRWLIRTGQMFNRVGNAPRVLPATHHLNRTDSPRGISRSSLRDAKSNPN